MLEKKNYDSLAGVGGPHLNNFLRFILNEKSLQTTDEKLTMCSGRSSVRGFTSTETEPVTNSRIL